MAACNKFKYALLTGIFLCFGCNAGPSSQTAAAQEAKQFAEELAKYDSVNQSQNQGSNQIKSGTVIGPANIPYAVDDAQIIQAQSQQARKVELTVTAPIKKLLREEDYREPHQRFLLILSNGTTVLVANDLQYGTYAPVQEGNVVRIHGEYIWNERGGVLHWTHKSDEPRHESGYIDFNGMRYQ
ncbi:MAG: DUF3465 domain-containing protein [Candidatus Melainabacteria bacterium]|nr:DUF3465 domain-containing protein [Candidatus Melainabacteria bacterium]